MSSCASARERSAGVAVGGSLVARGLVGLGFVAFLVVEGTSASQEARMSDGVADVEVGGVVVASLLEVVCGFGAVSMGVVEMMGRR